MTLIILAAIVIVLLLVLVGIYNRLVGLRQNCNQGWADIDTLLKQRHDLIPNLVATVQGYAAHEKSALEAVIAARAKAMGAGYPCGPSTPLLEVVAQRSGQILRFWPRLA